MSGLNDLGNEQLNDGVDFANMPEQGGSFKPALYPGSYRFELPRTLGAANFSLIDSKDEGKRVQVAFNENAPLQIVQSPDGQRDGEPFETRISNVPRNRARKGQPPQKASDWDYLNKALGVPKRPASNRQYAETLVAHATGQPYEGNEAPRNQFGADSEWSWNCGSTRDAYFEVQDPEDASKTKLERIPLVGEDGNPVLDPNTQEQTYQKGCGERVYQGGVKKVVLVDGEPARYPERITCSKCGASVRAFANLTRFVE